MEIISNSKYMISIVSSKDALHYEISPLMVRVYERLDEDTHRSDKIMHTKFITSFPIEKDGKVLSLEEITKRIYKIAMRH